ncbi:protein SPA, chloroplastic [Iris pallida]|nr:protein SPA, chloroplastic [Iris pallida]
MLNPKPVVTKSFSQHQLTKLTQITREGKSSLSPRKMSTAPSLPGLCSSFHRSSSSHPPPPLLRTSRIQRCARIRAVDLDQNTIIAITVGVASVAVGIGIPVFYETQIDSAAKRENTQACFPCSGSGAQQCRFCVGTGNVTVVLGEGETEVSKCINCEGAGSLTCTTCQGSGIQPRYLDRRFTVGARGFFLPLSG